MNSNDLNSLTFDELVPTKSKYLTKDDVGTAGFILTIKSFSMESIEGDGEVEEKTVMHFAEDVKPMVLNRTNAQLLAAATGAKTAGEARGKTVIVFNDPTITFGGKVTGGLRIKANQVEAPRAPGRPAAPAAPAGEPAIPF